MSPESGEIALPERRQLLSQHELYIGSQQVIYDAQMACTIQNAADQYLPRSLFHSCRLRRIQPVSGVNLAIADPFPSLRRALPNLPVPWTILNSQFYRYGVWKVAADRSAGQMRVLATRQFLSFQDLLSTTQLDTAHLHMLKTSVNSSVHTSLNGR